MGPTCARRAVEGDRRPRVGGRIIARASVGRRLAAPDDHFVARPDRRVCVATTGRSCRADGRPGVAGRIVARAAIEGRAA